MKAAFPCASLGISRPASLANLTALKRYPEAAALLREAVRLDPADAGARARLGAVLGQLGDKIAAESELREALHLCPDLIEARVNLGIALANQGRGPEALVEFERVLRESPGNETALAFTGMLREQAGGR